MKTPLALLLLTLMAQAGLGQEGDSPRTDVQPLEKLTTAFVRAYNDHDAKALAAHFVNDGELTERSGDAHVGRAEVEAAFAAAFEIGPQTKISISVQTIRFLTDDVAIADGTATCFPDGKTATADISYRIGYAKRDGKWKIAGLRAVDAKILSNYEYLRRLEWMVGDWVDEDDKTVVRAKVKWSPKRAFLLREFTVSTGNTTVISGTQRIGWDPQKKQYRSWLFDSEGGYVEGHWTPVGSGWVVRSTGYLLDGTSVSGTARIDRDGDDRFTWAMFNRLRGSDPLPDVEVTVVRRPPGPQIKANPAR